MHTISSSYRIIAIFCLVGLLFAATSQASDAVFDPDRDPERVIWRSAPISVQLPLGKERRIHFPGTVQVGHRIASNNLDVLSVDGVVYLTAKQDFGTARMLVRDFPAGPDGHTYILNLKVVPKEVNVSTLHVMLPEKQHENVDEQSSQQKRSVTYEDLTRYAAQRFFAPERVWVQDSRIRSIEMRWPKGVAVPLLRGSELATIPVAAWRTGKLYLTAFYVRNLTERHVPVDLRQQNVRGQFLTATAQHGSVQAAGSGADETVIYMISNRPFEEAMAGYLDWAEVSNEE